jgi:hypothetical protein
MCPHYGDSRKPQAWCSILAKWTTANTPSCDWGKAQMANAHAREYMRKRHGYVKRYKVERPSAS